MWTFAMRRLAWAVPTIAIILMLTFLLTRMTPGDPVLYELLRSEDIDQPLEISSDRYAQMSRQLGLDKPYFYFSILPSNVPSSVVTDQSVFRSMFQFWAERCTNRTAAQTLIADFHDVRNTQSSTDGMNMVIAHWQAQDYSSTQHIELTDKERNLTTRVREVALHNRALLSYLPSVRWWGAENQFHTWLAKAIRLDFGKSRDSNESAALRLWYALRWTLVVNVLSIGIAYLLAIPLGMYRAHTRGSRFDRWSGLILNLLYALPVFWLGSMLVVFFSTSEYGSWTNIFPSVGIWVSYPGDSFMQMMARNSGQLLIPVITLSTSLMAYISQQMRASAMEELHKTYVLHLRAKGLSENQVLWKHVFRNASFPLITMLAGVLPATLGGALVMEVICNIPGMGRLMFDSVLNQDWNLVMLVVLAGSLITVLGILLSDLAYAWVDPRINLKER